ncbi:MAG TPA: alkaline phosphatase D family protein [Acidimicrobiales bacterium]|nr:alkaline phosphatase D family protein [Acidimicrobiales bacterium]
MEISRRSFLLGSAALLAVGACSGDDEPTCDDTEDCAGSGPPAPPIEVPTPAAPATPLPGPPFGLGVASGDPDDESVVLWTRLLGAEGDHEVAWEVLDATDHVVAAGLVTATAADGHSVHVVADGLSQDAWYSYRFHTAGHTSPVGRARVLPTRDGEALRFAFASCQDWRDGHWSAHEHLAAEELDLVVWLGDYIYEGGDGDRQVRDHGAPACQSLDDYRARYALYKAHPHLQAAHAARPWLVVWDDHEVVNDFAGGADEIADRQAAAYKAWWEHMPVRMPAPTGPALDINRVVRFGEIASFVMIDGRQFRSDQACGGGIAPACDEVADPSRTMLGTDQEAWVARALSTSETAWNVIANQTILAPSEIVGLVNLDQWDGYPAARQRLYDAIRSSDAGTVVITGDVHASAVGNLVADDGTHLGVELVGTSISSTFPADLADVFELAATAAGAEMADAHHRGYVVCEVTKDAFRADYRIVESVAAASSPISTSSSWVIEDGAGVQPL